MIYDRKLVIYSIYDFKYINKIKKLDNESIFFVSLNFVIK
jgi:hypothetical protein